MATETKPGLIERLRAARAEKARAREEKFAKLAEDIDRGEELSVEAVEDLLESAGRTEDDLAAALAEKERRAALRSEAARIVDLETARIAAVETARAAVVRMDELEAQRAQSESDGVAADRALTAARTALEQLAEVVPDDPLVVAGLERLRLQQEHGRTKRRHEELVRRTAGGPPKPRKLPPATPGDKRAEKRNRELALADAGKVREHKQAQKDAAAAEKKLEALEKELADATAAFVREAAR